MYIFHVPTGKLLQTIDESDAAYQAIFAQNGLLIDAFHFAKRLKLEATLREKVPIFGIPKIGGNRRSAVANQLRVRSQRAVRRVRLPFRRENRECTSRTGVSSRLPRGKPRD